MSVLSVIGISDIKTRSGKALASSPTEYTTAIKNTIKSNNEIIKACNEKLKELENKK